MKLNRSHIAWSFALLTCLSGAWMISFGADSVQSADAPTDGAQATAVAAPSGADSSAAAEGAKEPAKDLFSTSAANSCLSDPVVLKEITAKKQELEQRQKDLSIKEGELKARETALNDELKKLQTLRDEIAKLDGAHRAENQEKVEKVVATLSTMSPKSAATLLTTLDDALAVSAISQIDTIKLAKIMNVIDPRRATKLTELLAGVVRAKNTFASNDAAATTQSPQSLAKKGEQTNDSKNESIISGGPGQVAERAPSNQTSAGK